MVCPIIDKTTLCLPSLMVCHRFGTKLPFPPANTTWLPTTILPAVKILLLAALVTDKSLPPIRLGIKDTTSNCSSGLLLLISPFLIFASFLLFSSFLQFSSILDDPLESLSLGLSKLSLSKAFFSILGFLLSFLSVFSFSSRSGFSSPSNIPIQTRTTILRPRSASTMLPLQIRSDVVL